jgi:hypothetical protein
MKEKTMDLIHTYTRKQAIEDGFQHRLDDTLTLEAGFNWPIFITSTIHDIITRAAANEHYLNDITGITWDILTVLKYTIGHSKDNSTIRFTVKILGAGHRQNFNFIAQVGPVDIDNPDPAITIMLPEEI